YRVIDRSGDVRDDASAKLRAIRTEIANARISIGHVFDRLLRDRHVTRWLRYANATFHEDRLVLPLAAEHRGRVPGIVHRSSDSGATLFVEPAEAVELNNRIITLKNDEQTEISRLLWNLTHQLHLNSEEILKTLDALAILDLIAAKARFARSYDLHIPQISDDGSLRLRQAKHLLLVDMQKQAAGRGEKREVVPIDIRLGDDFDVLIITGPNTGGKTVVLKTVALACTMAQSGLPIPAAEGSRVPIYHDILVDIGDEQSLQQSLSTFSSHISQVMTMLKHARPGTLMLIDELGAGTDPEEGAALGRAIVTELLKRKCPALVTTHLGVLKSLAYTEPRAENACVDFDAQTLRPTYRLLIGEPGNSNAINIASRLGLPSHIVKAARAFLADSHQQLTRAIAGTLRSRRLAELARQQSEAARVEAEKQQAAAESARRELQEQQARFERWVAMILSLQPGHRVLVRRFDREGTIVRMLLHKQMAVVSVGAMEMEVPIKELLPLTDDRS
ncbi:MAG: endonuclease MutS2, partial [Phycisphaerae bacterium]